MTIKIKRAYEEPREDDGIRILIDRLWPRGVKKDYIKIKDWMKNIAPSWDLIKWFSHKSDNWEEFKKRYKKQLKEKEELVDKLKKISKKKTLTLVYSSSDEEHNNAIVLKEVLES
ncbi:Uncharacterised protein [uncultured archaeon]|nr:Uncharacterised protein [uncultured archaeon]